jgi:hypothetical protein
MAVLERRQGAEVALQPAANGITGQRAQQLAALGLRRRRDLVLGDSALPVSKSVMTVLTTR